LEPTVPYGDTTLQLQGFPASTHIQTASILIYCVIFIVGTLGNALVIYMTGFKMQKTVNSIWFLNLAIADFLFTAFLIFSIISLSQSHQWPFGQFVCKLNNFVTLVNMFASIFTLTAISLDRCLSIWLISAGIWVIAGVFSTPYATFRTASVGNRGESSCGYSATIKEHKLTLDIFLISYVSIGIRAMRMPRTRRRRSRRVIFSIIFAFFICWLPFHIFSFIELKLELQGIVRMYGPLTVSLAFLNSCLNPILYVFMCEEFQKKFRQSICFVLESALAEDHLSFLSAHVVGFVIPFLVILVS
uniref:G-protein coupled receptors family 1 profile domain-containing protein n=1 Tax=Pundamilia nyererei TaxID=303518 RepID=A0A3B4FN60_9CICH